MRTAKQQLIALIEAVVPDEIACVQAEVAFHTNEKSAMPRDVVDDAVRRRQIRSIEFGPSDYLSGQHLVSFRTEDFYGGTR